MRIFNILIKGINMTNKYRYIKGNTEGMYFVEEYQKSNVWKIIQVLYSIEQCRNYIKNQGKK